VGPPWGGKTLRRNGKAGSGEMTFDRRVADAFEVIEFLRQHLGVDKVVVLAESMGTLTGLPLAVRRPDLVHALVVTDLYVNMAANEARKWQLTLERLRAAGNAKGITALERIGPDPARWDLAAWNTNLAWAFRTNVPTPNLDRRLLFPLALSSPLYSLRDLYTLFAGFQWSTAQMFEELRAYDARRLAPASRSRSSCSRARPMCGHLDLPGHRVLPGGPGADQGAGADSRRRPLRRLHPARAVPDRAGDPGAPTGSPRPVPHPFGSPDTTGAVAGGPRPLPYAGCPRWVSVAAWVGGRDPGHTQSRTWGASSPTCRA
jgi:pimeloyl-ACP methyl ester carboxylesterase